MMRIIFVVVLLFSLNDRGQCSNNTKTCKDVFCYPEGLCWYDENNPPKCEDRCQPNPCKPGYKCKTEKGWCGNETCRPEAMCCSDQPEPPKKTCKEVVCYPEALCWYDQKNPPKCEDRCQPNPCKPSYYCITERGWCGNETCRPEASCYPNPTEPPKKTCKDVFCYPEALCWYDQDNPPKCEDRCQPNPCKPGYHCITEKGWCGNETCRPEAMCYPNPPDPKKTCKDIFCYPETLCWHDKNNPPKCEDLCQPNPCEPGYYCVTERGECGTDTCRPRAKCYLENTSSTNTSTIPSTTKTCKDLFCYPEALCWYDQYNPPKCEDLCQPNFCDPGFYCITERGWCGDDTCRPNFACYPNNPNKPVNPCEDKICYPEALCWFDKHHPARCEDLCQPNPCKPGHYCITQRGWCGNEHCRPVAVCYPDQENPCDGYNCPQNTECWYDKNHKPRCADPCATTGCPGGYICRPQKGECGDASCPPVGRCRNPCELLHCPENSFCYFDGKQGKCVNACASKTCPNDWQCFTEPVSCPNFSCPPEARCRDPCELQHCPENSVCYFNSTNKQTTCVDACATKTCPDGSQCVTEPVSCTDFNCPPEAFCRGPCDRVRCGENSLCYYDGKAPKCVNPCANKTCAPNTKCVPKVGACGTSACPPTARCGPLNRPPNSCDGIKCPANKHCTLVDTLEYPQVPVCDGNPCVRPRQPCCKVRDANGTCNNDGCYLKFKKDSCTKPYEPCQAKKVCLDPCRVEKKQCPMGTSCYKNEVECFAEPCNPVTTCRTACDSQNGTAPVCWNDQQCEKIFVNCAPDENGNYDPYSCKTVEYCKKKKIAKIG